jgi:exodeoxyribonuclease III
MYKVATWNVNSLNVRLPQVLLWLEQHQPDVFVLQELKLPEEKFPFEVFTKQGYYAVCNSQKTYNGVAILSKHPIQDVIKDFPDFVDPQRRVLAATISGIRVVNFYIPNGESTTSLKFDYKCQWLKAASEFLSQERRKHEKLVVMGDFNIAPQEEDVYDTKQWEGHVLFTPIERDFFSKWLSLGLWDAFRLFDQPEASFTWWDYRMASFRRNLGLRIDHILVSEALKECCSASYIDKVPRKDARPSDHAPVVLEWVI